MRESRRCYTSRVPIRNPEDEVGKEATRDSRRLVHSRRHRLLIVAGLTAAWAAASPGVGIADAGGPGAVPAADEETVAADGTAALRVLADENPLVAVASAWRHARTAATAGTMPPAALVAGIRYDLVCLGTTYEPGRDARPSGEEARAYTREAFDALLRHVEPGGLFAWFAADETVFARGVLQVADLLEARGAPGGWSATAMALRLPAAASVSYRYALLVSNGPLEPESAARVAALERSLPVQALFAPGVTARGAWGAAAAASASRARDLLRRDLSRRAGAWRDLSAATSQRPGFFDLDRVAPAPLRAASGVAILALLAALLLPHPERRRAGAPTAPAWPFPMMLAPPGAFTAAGIFAAFALAGRAVALGGGPLLAPLAAGVGVVAGAVMAARARLPLPTAAWPALAGALVAWGWHAGLGAAFALMPSAPPGRAVLFLLAGVTAGIPAGVALPSARAAVAATMPDVTAAATAVWVLAAVAALVSAPWLLWWRGFPAVWIAAAACYAIGALTAALAAPSGAAR